MPKMVPLLAQVLRRAREEAGALQLDIAETSGASRPAISKWETHGVVPAVGLDELVSAYAAECGIPERILWGRALSRLKRES